MRFFLVGEGSDDRLGGQFLLLVFQVQLFNLLEVFDQLGFVTGDDLVASCQHLEEVLRQVERVVGATLQLLAIVVELLEVVESDAFQLRLRNWFLCFCLLLAHLGFGGALFVPGGGGLCVDTHEVIVVLIEQDQLIFSSVEWLFLALLGHDVFLVHILVGDEKVFEAVVLCVGSLLNELGFSTVISIDNPDRCLRFGEQKLPNAIFFVFHFRCPDDNRQVSQQRFFIFQILDHRSVPPLAHIVLRQ